MKGIMKKTFFTILILALTFPAMASEYTSRARVIESTPIVETVYEPVETCHYERRKVSKSGISNNSGNKLAGGLIGGVAGSAVGKGAAVMPPPRLALLLAVKLPMMTALPKAKSSAALPAVCWAINSARAAVKQRRQPPGLYWVPLSAITFKTVKKAQAQARKVKKCAFAPRAKEPKKLLPAMK